MYSSVYVPITVDKLQSAQNSQKNKYKLTTNTCKILNVICTLQSQKIQRKILISYLNVQVYFSCRHNCTVTLFTNPKISNETEILSTLVRWDVMPRIFWWMSTTILGKPPVENKHMKDVLRSHRAQLYTVISHTTLLCVVCVCYCFIHHKQKFKKFRQI